MDLKMFTIQLMDDGICSEEVVITYPLVMFITKTNSNVDSRFCVEVKDILRIADEIRKRAAEQGELI